MAVAMRSDVFGAVPLKALMVKITRENRSRRRLIAIAIGATLLFFYNVPIGFVLYAGAATALRGIGILGFLIVLQLPAFLLFKKMGWIPPVGKPAE